MSQILRAMWVPHVSRLRRGIAASALLVCFFTAGAQQQTGAPAGIALPAAPPASPPAATADISPESHSFRVRVLDGRNGAPIRDAHVKLWYDEPSGEGYIVATDARGIGLMPAPIGQPIRVLAQIDNFVDCRRSDRYAAPTGYNLASIAGKGTAAGNTCGDIAVHTSAGELLLFVRPMHWYEGLNRNP